MIPTTDDLLFVPETHEFFVPASGRKLPSVTRVLKSAGLIDDQWFTEESRQRGSAVHAALHYHDENDLDLNSVDGQILPYISAWDKFKAASMFVPAMIEQPVFHADYGFAGILDRVGTIGDERVLIDIKSGSAQPWAALQTAAYALALDSMGYITSRRGVVAVRPNGTWSCTWYFDENDESVFLAALALNNWKELHR